MADARNLIISAYANVNLIIFFYADMADFITNELVRLWADAIKNLAYANVNLIIFFYADMAELADAPDLGSGGRPCRFKSCYPHFL